MTNGQIPLYKERGKYIREEPCEPYPENYTVNQKEESGKDTNLSRKVQYSYSNGKGNRI